MKIRQLASRSRAVLLGVGLCAVILASLILGRVLAAPASGYTLDWFSIDGGGGSSAGGAYQLSGALGQPEGGTLAGGDYSLQGGFWQQSTYTINLPLVMH